MATELGRIRSSSPPKQDTSAFIKQQPFTASLVLYMLLFAVVLIGNPPLKVKSTFVYTSPIFMIGLLGLILLMSGQELGSNYLIWVVVLAGWMCVIITSRTTLIDKEEDIKGEEENVEVAFMNLKVRNYGQEQWGLSPISGGILALNLLVLLVISCVFKGKGIAENLTAFTLCYNEGESLVSVHVWTIIAIIWIFLFTSTLAANFMDLIYAQSNYIDRVKEKAKINNNLPQVKAPLDKIKDKLNTSFIVLGVGTLLFTLAAAILLVMLPAGVGSSSMGMILATLFSFFTILIMFLWFLVLVPSQQHIKSIWKQVAK